MRARTRPAPGHLLLTAAALAALLLAGGAPSAARTARAALPACTEQAAAAAPAVQQFMFDPNARPPITVLCGAFLGPGSRAMAVTFNHGVCTPNFGWSLYRPAAGTWQLVAPPGHVTHLIVAPLRALPGGAIRERWGVFRKTDTPCLPTGATLQRIWRFNGSAFVPGKTTTVKSAAAKKPAAGKTPAAGTVAASTTFRTPTHNIVCVHNASGKSPPFVGCGIRSGLRPTPAPITCREGDQTNDRMSLQATGRAGVGLCSGDPGPFLDEAGAPVLAYGKTWRGGPGFSCVSTFAGLTCRNRQAHGFFLSKQSYRVF
jgi:hypothetical protein